MTIKFDQPMSFDHPIVKLSLNAALVYGAACAGRSYLQINPLHATLFAAATNITSLLVKQLAQQSVGKHFNQTINGRSIHFICTNQPAVYTIASKVFSPIQAIAAIGINSMCDGFYWAITGKSIWM